MRGTFLPFIHFASFSCNEGELCDYCYMLFMGVKTRFRCNLNSSLPSIVVLSHIGFAENFSLHHLWGREAVDR